MLNMPKLSEIYHLIGRYLFQKGDKVVSSVGTVCGATTDAYLLHLHDIDSLSQSTGSDEIVIPKCPVTPGGWPYVVLVSETYARDTQIYLPDVWEEDWEGIGNFKEQAWCDTDRNLFAGVYNATSEASACQLASEDQGLPVQALFAFPAVGKDRLR